MMWLRALSFVFKRDNIHRNTARQHWTQIYPATEGGDAMLHLTEAWHCQQRGGEIAIVLNRITESDRRNNGDCKLNQNGSFISPILFLTMQVSKLCSHAETAWLINPLNPFWGETFNAKKKMSLGGWGSAWCIGTVCCVLHCTFVSVVFWPLWGHWLRSRTRRELFPPPLHPQLATNKPTQTPHMNTVCAFSRLS